MKMVNDYEVEGCWTSMDKKEKPRCRKCGSILKLVPKEKHFNSRYWKLQRNDGLLLACCPKGCAEKDAVKSYKEFSLVRNYCTKDSNSWNYKLDYTIIRNAWINRGGKIFPCEYRGHVDLAFDLNSDEITLERKGWLKLSASTFIWDFRGKVLSNKQIDVIFDYINIYNKKKLKEFQEKIDDEIGMLKLK